MSDMLAIGQTGIRAYARALDTLADNVANAATPGHVRRTTALTPVNQGGNRGPLELDPGGGSGVRISAVVRAADLLQIDTLRRAEGETAALEIAGRWLATIEAALTGPNAIDAPLSALFGSLSDLAGDPTNPGLGDTVLARADILARQFNRSAAELARIDEDLLVGARLEMRSLNDLSQSLADINGRLRRVTAGTAAAAALADARDRTLASIASITTIDVTLDGSGQARVRIPDAGGPLLVEGSRAVSARVLSSATGLELRLGPTGADQPATLVSGTLAGLGAARIQLSESRARLDALADRIAQSFNTAHAQGVDRSGADGGALFETNRPVVTPARANGGDSRVRVTVADGSPVVPMTLAFDGTTWTLARPDTGASVVGALPLTLDGLSVEAAGDPRPGDLFRIQPAGGAAAIGLRDLTSAQLATAQRWLSEPGASNVGNARLELATAPPLVPPATGPFTLSFSAGVYTLADADGLLLGSGPQGSWIAGDGFAVLAGAGGAEGDSHIIVRNGPDSGANGNVLALLAVRDSQGPQGTPGDEADALVSRVATARAAQQARFETARESRNQAAEALTLSSGVDLDTEAAEMLRLQQAYSANARVLQAAREIFDTLLNSSR